MTPEQKQARREAQAERARVLAGRLVWKSDSENPTQRTAWTKAALDRLEERVDDARMVREARESEAIEHRGRSALQKGRWVMMADRPPRCWAKKHWKGEML